MHKRKIINFLFAEDYLGCYPSLINALSIIDNDKINANFLGFFFKSSFPDYPKLRKVNYRLIKRPDKINRSYEINEGKPSLIISYIEKIINRLKINLYFSVKYNLLSLRKNYYKVKDILWILLLLRRNKSIISGSYLICIDSNTLIGAYIYKTILKKRFDLIFWSLEISSYNQIDLLDRVLEKIEFFALRDVTSVISQSEERLALINNIKKISTDQIDSFFIPHSRLYTNNIKRKNYFNDSFRITKESTILLHLGWVHDVMDSYNLAKSTLDWKKDIQLVFHERAKRDINDEYIKNIFDIKSDSLHLSLNPVPYEQLGDLIASCDFGIVVYKPEKYGVSWKNIAKASGKLADYLAFGKPVICSNLPDLKELIEKYECGLVFNEYKEIPSLIAKINENYNFYSSNALKCFSNEFEFSKFFNPFLKRLKPNH